MVTEIMRKFFKMMIHFKATSVLEGKSGERIKQARNMANNFSALISTRQV